MGSNEVLFDIFFYVYLENISVAGRGLDDAQSLELSSQQCQHAAVDVIQADAWRTQGQAGALHLQNGLVQFSLHWAESAKGGCGETAHGQSDARKITANGRRKDVPAALGQTYFPFTGHVRVISLT